MHALLAAEQARLARCHQTVRMSDEVSRRKPVLPVIARNLCTGCGKCIPVCNFRAIRLVKRVAEVAAGSA